MSELNNSRIKELKSKLENLRIITYILILIISFISGAQVAIIKHLLQH